MLKKFFLTLTLLLLSLKPTYAAFSDVPIDYVYKDAVNYVQEEGIVNGYSDGTFRPGNPITRGEFTKIIINSRLNDLGKQRCLGMDADPFGYSFPDQFIDIKGGEDWNGFDINQGFYMYICLAKINGIVSGYSDGTFKQDEYITVKQASKIVSNAFEYTGSTKRDLDLYLDVLKDAGAIDNEIYNSGDNYANRGQVAFIITNILSGGVGVKSTSPYNRILSSLKIENPRFTVNLKVVASSYESSVLQVNDCFGSAGDTVYKGRFYLELGRDGMNIYDIVNLGYREFVSNKDHGLNIENLLIRTNSSIIGLRQYNSCFSSQLNAYYIDKINYSMDIVPFTGAGNIENLYLSVSNQEKTSQLSDISVKAILYQGLIDSVYKTTTLEFSDLNQNLLIK
ncbi:S-layer homology domain-containing protein [Candidatus Dojkabacteria bacterium]|nr:S-layer homology domain-containing protein [Candidatus Dojkabacteria bacterium]